MKLRYFIILPILALAGFGATSAITAPPGEPPGQGTCAHGNSSTPCKTDPSTNGKDCDPHGNNGGVNEDHCLGTTSSSTTVTTSTSSTSTSTPTTTTTPKTTSSTSSTTNTSPTTTSSTSTSGTTTSSSTTTGSTTTTSTTSPVVGTTTTTSGAPAGTTTTTSQPSTNKPVKPKRKTNVVGPPLAAKGTLPYTGMEDNLLVIIGVLMTFTGFVLRRVKA